MSEHKKKTLINTERVSGFSIRVGDYEERMKVLMET